MFEELILLGPTERGIRFQTRQGTDIPNLIELDPGPAEVRRHEALLARFGQKWRLRKPAIGGYNCAGHVWASRRTAILDSGYWRIILQEDGYRRLRPQEERLPDDLVIYLDEANNDFLHVGRIVEVQEGVAEGAKPVALVVSKWNSTSGEVIHFVHDHPYREDQGFRVRSEYWTDRP